MSSIFDKFSVLDWDRARHQVETTHGSPIFDHFSHDPVRAQRQMADALPATFDAAYSQDDVRALAEIDAALTGGENGVPDWVPAGALVFADFVNARFYAEGIEGTLDEVFGSDPDYPTVFDLANISAEGYGSVNGNEGFNADGILLSAILSGSTIVMRVSDGVTGQLNDFYLEFYDDGNFNVDYITRATVGAVYFDGVNANVDFAMSATTDNVIAMTLTAAARSISVNGGAVISGSPMTEMAQVARMAIYLQNTKFLRTMAVYAPRSDADLPGLSGQL